MPTSAAKPRRIGARPLILLRVLFTMFLLATVVFIFLYSSDVATLSTARSAAVTALLNRFMGALGLDFHFSVGLVRKLAHFAEFALLGFWLILTLRVYTRRVVSFLAWPLFLGLFTAVSDEFFQTLAPGRAGQVSDVMLDFGGVLAGVLAGLFAILLAGALWDALHGRR